MYNSAIIILRILLTTAQHLGSEFNISIMRSAHNENSFDVLSYTCSSRIEMSSLQTCLLRFLWNFLLGQNFYCLHCVITQNISNL